jgi:hypothetical protein
MVNREQRTEASARQLSWQSKMICRNLVEEICSGIIQKAVDLLKVPVPCCNIPVPLDCILILRGYIPQKNVMKIVAYLSLLRCRTHFAQTNFVPLNFMVATIYRIIFSRPTTLASFFWRTCPRGEGN